jgi:glutamate-5-semialdehyde dehydrogenase
MIDPSRIAPGTPIVVGAKVVPMPEVAGGDRVIPVGRTGDLLIIERAAHAAAAEAVADAAAAVRELARASAEQVSGFFESFARRLTDDDVWRSIADANRADVAAAEQRGRSTTRLRVSDGMRASMIDGLRVWAASPTRVGEVIERREADDHVIERRRAPLGVVAFVFEGRPNVFADGAGVVRNGNAAVMRIGGDALGTAIVIEEQALRPALRDSGLPEAALRLVRSRDHAAGQALFTLPEVRLAVARGSGRTVALLGAIAEQHGIPASLHGTGGAWMYVEASAAPDAVESAIVNSLDRKVCNTLNVLLVERAAVPTLGQVCARALARVGAKVHALPGAEAVTGATADLQPDQLALEWEWETTPELSVAVVDGLAEAAALFNRHSPRFVASILSRRPGAFEEFYAAVDAPYVGDGFTRWVDGQWAWHRPELGLTNWERGRLLGRSGFLSGDDVVTVRDVFRDRTGRAPQRR